MSVRSRKLQSRSGEREEEAAERERERKSTAGDVASFNEESRAREQQHARVSGWIESRGRDREQIAWCETGKEKEKET